MDISEKLSIRVNIADRYYPMKVERSDEAKIRQAAKMINEKIMQYKQRYKDKDLQDFLAMAALQFVTKVIETENNQDITTLVGGLQEIDRELSEYLDVVL